MKGAAFEREVVTRFEEMGIKAKKMPLSGAIPGFEGDVEIWPAGHIDFKMKIYKRDIWHQLKSQMKILKKKF